MSEEEMEILKELSEQNYFGDLPFLLYADLIGKLIANYNKEKEKNKELEEEDVKIRAKFILQLENYIPKSKVEELLKEIENRNYNDYTGCQDGNEVKYNILLELQSLLGKE